MPTRRHLFSLRHTQRARAAAMAASGALLAACLLAGCASPRIAGRAESERQLSACETAFAAASAHTDAGNDSSSLLLGRYMASLQAQHEWLDVAMQCPLRFVEGTMRSAQMQYRTRQLAGAIGVKYQPLTVSRLDDVSSLPLDGDALAQAALADDRAGFATEVLAGRFVSGDAADPQSSALADDGTLLAMSDNHKQTASQMMRYADGAKDLRRKLYATDDLLAHSATMTDPANGLQANTVAVIEMSCAREELKAVDEAVGTMRLPDDQEGRRLARNGLLQLSMLIATHAYTAFDLGYPSGDYALFEPSAP